MLAMIATPSIPAEFVHPLKVGKLGGRLVELPSKKSGGLPFLLVYGHHSSLERMYSIAQAFSEFGPVIMPDLPGFGGMMSLPKVGEEPSLDNLADYLADFIRQHFGGKPFRAVGMSLGFVLLVRMLQRHPDLQPQVKLLVSAAGFTHGNDFALTPSRRRLFARTAKTLAHRAVAKAFAGTLLRKPVIATTYHLRARSHSKMKGFSYQQRKALIDFEVVLWQSNEAETYFSTLYQMLTLDLTKQKIALPVHHIAVSNDQYLNNGSVERHFAEIFTGVHIHEAIMPSHMPTVIEEIKEAGKLIPASLAKVFNA